MTCNDWEERVAQYAGGDLAPAEASAVVRHLGECAGCQLLLSGLREGLGLLREAHAEPVEAAHFAAVRARVLSELERSRRPWWHSIWVYATVMAAIAVLVAVRPIAPRKPNIAVEPAAPPVIAALPEKAPPVALPSPKRAKPVQRTRQDSDTVLVKLETNDPDVVIYWIAETKGEPR